MADRFLITSPDANELAAGVALNLQRRNAGNTAWETVTQETIAREGLAAATQDIAVNSRKITGLATPTAAGDAATKAYADAAAAGARDPKDACVLATTANVALTGEQNIDGTVTSGSRVLVKNQAAGAENGIYVTAAGAWTRATDADTSAEVTTGMFVWVTGGATQAKSGWLLTTADPITLGTTALTFAQVSGLGDVTAGAGLTKSGNTLDVGAGDGITVGADTVAVSVAAIAGTNLEDDGANNLRIAAAAAGAGLTGGGASALAVAANADGSIVVNANDVQVGVISDAQHGNRGNGALHQNAVAGTPGTAGFMTGSDKLKLDTFPEATFAGTLQTADVNTHDVTFDTLSTNNRSRGYVIEVSAVKSDGTKGIAASIKLGVRRTGGANAILTGGPVIGYQGHDDNNWSVTVVLSGDNVQIRVQDSTAGPETVDWQWRGYYTEAP